MSAPRSVLSSAKLIGICTLSSRVTGMVRDMLLMQVFGLTWVLDAFTYAFQFPNLFRRLFAEGALAAVFVPTFTRATEQGGRPAARQLLARTLALLGLVLIAVVLTIEAVILVIWLLTPADWTAQGDSRRLLLGLTALMLPFMITICVVALLSSILNCLDSFVPAALTPAILNVVMIAGILWLGPMLGGDSLDRQVFGIALSVLLAGVLQLAFLVPVLHRYGVRLGWSLELRDPQVRHMLRLMGPVLLGQGVLMLSTFLDAQMCALLTHVAGAPETANWFGLQFRYPLEEGALSAITVAQRLYQFPLGVFGISLAVAALPTFSRLAAREEWSDWAGEVQSALRLSIFVGLIAGAMMVLVSQPIVRLLFEYRRFTAEDTVRAARVLVCYGLGMWAFCAQHIVLRAFYSVGDVRTPLKIAAWFVPLNLMLNVGLVWIDAVREAAFGLSTAFTSTLTVVVGLWLLRRRVAHAVVRRELVWAVARMLAAAAAAGVIVVWTLQSVLPRVGVLSSREIIVRAVEALGALALGTLVYLVVAWMLRLPEPRLLVLRRWRRPAAVTPPANGFAPPGP